jgi:hypothetical protein
VSKEKKPTPTPNKSVDGQFSERSGAGKKIQGDGAKKLSLDPPSYYLPEQTSRPGKPPKEK